MKTKEKFELYKPKKFLGQNFLVDDNIARKIVASLGIESTDPVIEIGPGRGALTKHIAGLTNNFTAVEFDKGVHANLQKEFGEGVNLVHSDFLEFDLASHSKKSNTKLKIIGNIPYNITSKILFKLFDVYELVDCVVLMVQKEVASRLIAKTRSKEYGILSVQTQIHCKPEVLFHVPPTAFFPKPSVKSSIIKFSFNGEQQVRNIVNMEIFRSVLRESFGQRRKFMSNSLSSLFEKYELAFGDIDFDFTRRPETLSPEEFVTLGNQVAEKIMNHK
ncbi:MAG: ribosomal RNA small subunit methyltransferase A [Ignavibacteria bacterium]|nr:ribosomal RNA small subunit methyltransferase A [Ignavibacteria bacterium]